MNKYLAFMSDTTGIRTYADIGYFDPKSDAEEYAKRLLPAGHTFISVSRKDSLTFTREKQS